MYNREKDIAREAENLFRLAKKCIKEMEDIPNKDKYGTLFCFASDYLDIVQEMGIARLAMDLKKVIDKGIKNDIE